MTMKLRWFWVEGEKVLRYSTNGVAWHDVPCDPRPPTSWPLPTQPTKTILQKALEQAQITPKSRGRKRGSKNKPV